MLLFRSALGGLSRKEIIESVKQSLMNLGMEYIDLVIVHKMDPNCPLEGMSSKEEKDTIETKVVVDDDEICKNFFLFISLHIKLNSNLQSNKMMVKEKNKSSSSPESSFRRTTFIL